MSKRNRKKGKNRRRRQNKIVTPQRVNLQPVLAIETIQTKAELPIRHIELAIPTNPATINNQPIQPKTEIVPRTKPKEKQEWTDRYALHYYTAHKVVACLLASAVIALYIYTK